MKSISVFNLRQSTRFALTPWCCMALLAVAPAQAADSPAAGVAAEVEAHLNAGEFGAAADLAKTLPTEARTILNERIVHAQIQNGDLQGAMALVPQMGNVRESQSARAEVARNEVLEGGTGADFQSLMRLIQNETDGEWFDIDGAGGTMDPFESGVRVDPRGVLARESREELSGRLASLGLSARSAAINEDMARPSTMRLVSLTRLEEEVSRRLAAGKPVVESMEQLAGLSKIQYVFVYPEDGEIVLGGPAEGWRYNETGTAVGLESGKPTLQLEDLVTVLRTFSPAGMGIFGCSIDPKAENLAAVKEFAAASQSRGPLSPNGVRSWANRIGHTLGLQDITVYGVPENSRVARVLVEADYRMKLIGIGKLESCSNIPDYFDLLAKNPSLASGSLDALRWWMTMKYDAVLHSADRTAYEIQGSAVQCLSENQYLGENGQRVNTGKAEPINRQFAENFTQHYAELASQDPIFADMQGVFDLALVAALIQRHQLDQKAGWDRGAFAANGDYKPARYATPRHTESVVNHRVFNGKDVVLQVAGGVRADLAAVLQDDTIQQESSEVGTIAESTKSTLPEGRWWWDAQ